MFSSSMKKGGLADSATLNIPYSPCFPYSGYWLLLIHSMDLNCLGLTTTTSTRNLAIAEEPIVSIKGVRGVFTHVMHHGTGGLGLAYAEQARLTVHTCTWFHIKTQYR